MKSKKNLTITHTKLTIMFFSITKSITTLTLCILILFIGDGCTSNFSPQKKLFSIHYDFSMPRSNIALIIPGMNQTDSNPGFNFIGDYYKNKGITPVYVNIDWKSVGINNLSTSAFQIKTLLKDSFPDSHVFLFGFSFGAVISLKLAQLIDAEQILLCSMSPVFAEDRVNQRFPFKQIAGFISDYSLNGLSYSASQRTCINFLYGDHDSFLLNKAIIQSRKSFFRCSETIIVKNAHHNISDQTYLKAIYQFVQRINK